MSDAETVGRTHERLQADATEVNEHPVYVNDDEDELVLTTESLLTPPSNVFTPPRKEKPSKLRRIRVPHVVVARRTNECRVPLSSIVLLLFVACALTGTFAVLAGLRRGVLDCIISFVLIIFELTGELCKCRSMGLGRLLLDHSCRTALYLIHSLVVWAIFEATGNGVTLCCAIVMSLVFLGSLVATFMGASAPASLHCWDCRISRVKMVAQAVSDEADEEDPMNEA